MKKNKKQLSMQERWAIDAKMAQEAHWKTKTPQCKKCKYFIERNAISCEIFEEKPKPVMFADQECFKCSPLTPLQTKEDEKKLQIIGSIFGFCVGDALGVPVEFETKDTRDRDPVKEMRAYGTHHQYFGTWSDDSSLTFCLMESLTRGYDLFDVAKTFCNFYYNNYWTPYGEVFDVGSTTVTAITKMQQGINPIDCGGRKVENNGNGSLMRILPLAYYLKKETDVSKKIKIIEDVSSLTHAHKRSKLACIIYIEYLINLLIGLNKEEAYKEMVDFIASNCQQEYGDELHTFKRIINENISEQCMHNIASSGYVVDTLEAALWAFINSESYEETIFKAINLGNDTDTIAAIAGSMAGLYYEFEAIPQRWIETIARKQDIYDLAISFSKKINVAN